MNERAPIFRGILRASWDRLSPVRRQHYANRPCSRDEVVIEGVTAVALSRLARLAAPLLWISRTLVPISG